MLLLVEENGQVNLAKKSARDSWGAPRKTYARIALLVLYRVKIVHPVELGDLTALSWANLTVFPNERHRIRMSYTAIPICCRYVIDTKIINVFKCGNKTTKIIQINL